MTKLKGILLTEGMHGMISQVEGLAKALDIEFIHEKIVINNFWKIIPPRFTPIKKFVFKNNLKKDFNIVISCGRKSVIPSIFLKKKYRNKIVNIHIQDPKVSLKNFDFIVVPEHDNLVGENVLQSKGAIHYLQENELEKSKNYLKSEIKKEKLVTLIMGGPNKYYDYNDEDIDKIFKKIKENFINNGYQLVFIPSMRTPQIIIDKAKNYYNENQIIITSIDKNAYLSSLKLSDHIVVTCDSISMISEAAITGKPIYVAHMPNKKKNERFKKFFDLFKSLNIIRDLEDSVEYWSYKKLDETNRISRYIKDKLKNYDFS
tara:strand:- start:1319 stop:2269 length:951 start_codon:yes stop_codon:yes gene_type:complete